MNKFDYNEELESIVVEAITLAVEEVTNFSDVHLERIQDRAQELVYELVDNHRWVIYNRYHLDVLRMTNAPLWVTPEDWNSLKEESLPLDTLHMHMVARVLGEEASDVLREKATPKFIKYIATTLGMDV